MHYKNGREAKVGDPVVGITYNIKGSIAGTLLSVTPGQDTCSALVGTIRVVHANTDGKFPRSAGVLVRIQGTINHGNAGEQVAVYYVEDYTHCANLLHAEDALKNTVNDARVGFGAIVPAIISETPLTNL